jgi:hypothetical protein
MAYIESKAVKLLELCDEKGDVRNASAILGQLLRAAELVGKRTGELVDRRETQVQHGGVIALALPQLAAPGAVEGRKRIAGAAKDEPVAPAVARLMADLDAQEAEFEEIPPPEAA